MQIDGQVCTISVDNVAKKNAYTPAMLDRLAELLTEFEDNDDLRPLVRGAAAEDRPGVAEMVLNCVSQKILGLPKSY